MTRGVRPVERECNARLEEINEVVKSVSAAVPAPAHLSVRNVFSYIEMYSHIGQEGWVPYIWSDVVDLFAVFVGDNGA